MFTKRQLRNESLKLQGQSKQNEFVAKNSFNCERIEIFKMEWDLLHHEVLHNLQIVFTKTVLY